MYMPLCVVCLYASMHCMHCMQAIFCAIDCRCHCNSCASGRTVLGIATVVRASIPPLSTPVRPHGAVPVLAGGGKSGVCYRYCTIQAIGCDDCVSQAAFTTDSKFTVTRSLHSMHIENQTSIMQCKIFVLIWQYFNLMETKSLLNSVTYLGKGTFSFGILAKYCQRYHHEV